MHSDDLDHDRAAELMEYPIELGVITKQLQEAEALESPEPTTEALVKAELEARRLPYSRANTKKLLRELTNAPTRRQVRGERMRTLWDAVYGTAEPPTRFTTHAL